VQSTFDVLVEDEGLNVVDKCVFVVDIGGKWVIVGNGAQCLVGDRWRV